jgi:hypothetical protein
MVPTTHKHFANRTTKIGFHFIFVPFPSTMVRRSVSEGVNDSGSADAPWTEAKLKLFGRIHRREWGASGTKFRA